MAAWTLLGQIGIITLMFACYGTAKPCNPRPSPLRVSLSSYASCDLGSNTLASGSSHVKGRVEFRQRLGLPVEIFVNISGLPVTPMSTVYGIAIHEYGAIEGTCRDVGGHFNPWGNIHGSPTDRDRHNGDLGNVFRSIDGTGTKYLRSDLISLVSAPFIIGRSVVIYADADDMGRGFDIISSTTGNLRIPISCCVIGFSNGKRWNL